MLLVSLDSSLPLRVSSNVYLLPTVCPVSCVLFDKCCQCHWILHCLFGFPLTFIYYLQSVLCLVSCLTNVASVSGFFIVSSVSSNVYLLPTVCPVSCVLFDKCCQCLWILHCLFGFPLTFIYYLQSVLCPVSCLTNVASVSGFFIASSVSSNVYLLPTVCPVSCVLFDKCCQCLWILHCLFGFPLTFIYYLQSVLCLVSCLTNVASVSGFFIASSVSSNVYLLPTVCPVSCVLFDKCCQCLWILHCLFGFPLTFIYYLQSVLCPVSCLTNVASVSGFFIASSVSSNVYLLPTVCPVSCVLLDKCCQCLWILHCLSGFPLTFIYYLQSVLCPVSCLTNVASVSGFFIASSVSSNVYLLPTVCPVSCVLFDKCCQCLWILHCLFGFL